MKKIRFSKKERRVIIVLMIVNCFALFVNVFKMDFNKVETSRSTSYYTDSQDRFIEVSRHTFTKTYYLTDLNDKPEDAFWPIVKFKRSWDNNNLKWLDTSRNMKRWKDVYRHNRVFRGVFADFDYTEFLVYSVLIFGIPILRKLW